jgi:hypothetical protein
MNKKGTASKFERGCGCSGAVANPRRPLCSHVEERNRVSDQKGSANIQQALQSKYLILYQ